MGQHGFLIGGWFAKKKKFKKKAIGLARCLVLLFFFWCGWLFGVMLQQSSCYVCPVLWICFNIYNYEERERESSICGCSKAVALA